MFFVVRRNDDDVRYVLYRPTRLQLYCYGAFSMKQNSKSLLPEYSYISNRNPSSPTFFISTICIVQAQYLKKKWYGQFFLSEGVISHIFFRYMHKDRFLCIFSQIKNNAYLPVHLVHAPIFLWSPSYSFTFSFLCFLSV